MCFECILSALFGVAAHRPGSFQPQEHAIAYPIGRHVRAYRTTDLGRVNIFLEP